MGSIIKVKELIHYVDFKNQKDKDDPSVNSEFDQLMASFKSVVDYKD